MKAAILILMSLCLFMACSTSQIQQNPQVINDWSGSSAKNTEPFTISHSPWTIEWEVIPTEQTAYLGIVVYSARTNLPVSMTGGEVNDMTYIYESGTFYLTIIPANCDWSIKVIGVP